MLSKCVWVREAIYPKADVTHFINQVFEYKTSIFSAWRIHGQKVQ